MDGAAFGEGDFVEDYAVDVAPAVLGEEVAGTCEGEAVFGEFVVAGVGAWVEEEFVTLLHAVVGHCLVDGGEVSAGVGVGVETPSGGVGG